MPELEARIAEWRARMTAAMDGRSEAVAELEEHLREHLAVLQREGKTVGDSLAIAQARIGDPTAVGREFDRMPVTSRPGLVILPGLAILLVLLVVGSLWGWSRRLPITPLQIASVITYVPGLFGVLGSGLIAASAFMTTMRRPLYEREQWAVRQIMRKLARLAVVFVTLGSIIGFWWHTQLVPRGPALWFYDVRLIAGTASVALLQIAQLQARGSDRLRWLAAILASCVFVFSSFGPRVRFGDIPVAWVGAAFLLGQVFLVLSRFRIVRVS